MEMWCAARHCAFESHPLRQVRERRELFRRSFNFVLGSGGMAREIKAELTNMCMVYEGSQVLVQRRSPQKGWPGVTFPGGHVEPGESVTQSVIREVWEETGLAITHPRLCGIKDWIEDDGSRYIVFLYKCNTFSGELRSSEEGEVFWANRADLPSMNLSSGMEETFRVFFEEDISELSYYREDPAQDLQIVLE